MSRDRVLWDSDDLPIVAQIDDAAPGQLFRLGHLHLLPDAAHLSGQVQKDVLQLREVRQILGGKFDPVRNLVPSH